MARNTTTTATEDDRLIDKLLLFLFVIAALLAVGVAVAAYYNIDTPSLFPSYKRPENMKTSRDGSVAVAAALAASKDPPPVYPQPRGEPKNVVWQRLDTGGDGDIDNEARFSLSDTLVVRWDQIPPTASTITVGFNLLNPPPPPSPSPSSPSPRGSELNRLLTSSDGLGVALQGDTYHINASGFGAVENAREPSSWDSGVERLEIRFTQGGHDGDGSTSVETIYNGDDSMPRSSSSSSFSSSSPGAAGKRNNSSVRRIREWSQVLRVMDTENIKNVWVTYSS